MRHVPAPPNGIASKAFLSQTVGALSITETRYEPGTFLAPHEHADLSLSLILDGSHRESVGRRIYDCLPNSAVLKAAGLNHANQVGPQGTHGLVVEMSAETVRSMSDAVVPRRGSECFDDARTRYLVRRVADELRLRQPGVDLIVEGLLFELLGSLLRNHLTRGRHRADRWLSRAIEYLEANYRKRIVLADVAECAGVHPSHLAEGFRSKHGMSVGEWVRNRRLEFVRDALLNHSRPISGIAFEAGFADQSHLTRLFRSRFGVTPAEYRRQIS